MNRGIFFHNIFNKFLTERGSFFYPEGGRDYEKGEEQHRTAIPFLSRTDKVLRLLRSLPAKARLCVWQYMCQICPGATYIELSPGRQVGEGQPSCHTKDSGKKCKSLFFAGGSRDSRIALLSNEFHPTNYSSHSMGDGIVTFPPVLLCWSTRHNLNCRSQQRRLPSHFFPATTPSRI